MYKIIVPVMNKNVIRSDRERLVSEIRRFDAERVLLALGRYELDPNVRKAALDELRENCAFFKAQGFEVGAWVWTFWLKGNDRFACMRDLGGRDITEFMCPSDENFVKFATDYIADVARCGVDLIQFDDDFRYGFLGKAPACLCENHVKRINEIANTNVGAEEISRSVLEGEKNALRDAYLQANGEYFRSFAKSMRDALDRVNPEIRLGACACMTSWDIDGTHARELAHILAGKTKPFVRLIGAPYWASIGAWGNCLQDVVELERMESAWTRDSDIEIIAEGDAYPRPRTACPASYLEGFDMAIRASGCTDGILKYGIDYLSNADYETGYAVMHEKNRAIYSKIDCIFRNKKSVGVRVYESMRKISDMVMPSAVNSQVDIQDLFFSKAARTLAYNTVPTVYEGEGVTGIVFDENARTLDFSALNKGLIIDIAAAEILTARGVDVGLKNIRGSFSSECERFLERENSVLTRESLAYDIEINDGALVLSTFEGEGEGIAASYRYENESGNRFLVLNVNTRSQNDGMLKSYERARQHAEIIPWLSGELLPAHTVGHPALYMQCKKDECGTLAVGLWNFHADTVFSPVIELDGEYEITECISAVGTALGNKVTLSDIAPFGFAAFEAKPKQV